MRRDRRRLRRAPRETRPSEPAPRGRDPAASPPSRESRRGGRRGRRRRPSTRRARRRRRRRVAPTLPPPRPPNFPPPPTCGMTPPGGTSVAAAADPPRATQSVRPVALTAPVRDRPFPTVSDRFRPFPALGDDFEAFATSSAKASVTTRRSGVRPETCSVEPVGFMSPEEDRSEASGACLFFAAYRAASAHGSTTGSQAAVRVLKCETSAVAATSAAIDGESLASTETRRSETRARASGARVALHRRRY